MLNVIIPVSVCILLVLLFALISCLRKGSRGSMEELKQRRDLEDARRREEALRNVNNDKVTLG